MKKPHCNAALLCFLQAVWRGRTLCTTVARHDTWLLLELTPKGVVFSFLFFSFLFFSFLLFSFLFFSFLFFSFLVFSFLTLWDLSETACTRASCRKGQRTQHCSPRMLPATCSADITPCATASLILSCMPYSYQAMIQSSFQTLCHANHLVLHAISPLLGVP